MPRVFISHKHADKAIALAIANFLRSNAMAALDIFLSSDSAYEGLRYGKPITDELRTTLANADVFLLVYTSPDEDWSWCMWEWGIANHPASAKTTMAVLQCGPAPPRINDGKLTVNVRNQDSVRGFIKQYYKDPNFFPSLSAPFGGFLEPDVVRDKADDLFGKLTSFPVIDPAIEWQTWPFLNLELPLAAVDRIKDVVAPLSQGDRVSQVRTHAKVVVADPKALAIFGLAGLTPDAPFSNLAAHWEAAHPGEKAAWFDSCCEQIATAAAEKLPNGSPLPVRAVDPQRQYVPLTTRVRRSSYEGIARFDLYFVDLPSGDGESVGDRMLTPDQFYWRPLNDDLLDKTTLLSLSAELKQQERNRLPLLDQNRCVKYVIHRSSIDEFIVGHLATAATLTLRHFLDDTGMRALVTNTFTVIGRDAPLAEAKAASSGAIRDFFVTATGSPAEPVEGWLTNVDLLKGRR